METADHSFQMLACHYIVSQLKKLCREINGAREGKDIECVHQSRVASRRIRAAFVIFENCFPAKKIKKWRREIKNLTKGLGPARDADVLIEFLSKVTSELDSREKTLYPGIRRLLLRTSQNRQKFQPAVIETIDRLDSKFTLADIHSTVQKMIFCLKYENVSVKSKYVFLTTSKHIRSRLKDFYSYHNCLKDPSDIQTHHKMRIAAKRLRYTMEMCKEPYNGLLNDLIKTVKKFQSLLGDIHDCDVWVEHITEFSKQELERTSEYFGSSKPYVLLEPGLEYLKQHLRQKRQQLFNDLVDYWEQLCDERVWDDLVEKIQEPLSDPVGNEPTIVEIRKRPLNETNSQINSTDRGHPR